MENNNYLILLNQITCLNCVKTVRSSSPSEMVWCDCKTFAVDGGNCYLRRISTPNSKTAHKESSLVLYKGNEQGKCFVLY